VDTTLYITGPSDDGNPSGSARDRRDNEATAGHDEPHPQDRHGDPPRQQSRGRHSREYHLPNRQAILAALNGLTHLVAAGILTPGQSNAMINAFRLQLANLPREVEPARANQVNPASLRDAVRMAPDLLDLIAPLLSDEQLRQLVDEPGEGAADGT
jgi:hypothetical protein